MSNKFLLSFDLGGPDKVHGPEWIVHRLELQNIYRTWCIERISISEGFPNWQFSTRYVYTASMISSDTSEVLIADGIFIFDEESRAAFKLTFQL